MVNKQRGVFFLDAIIALVLVTSIYVALLSSYRYVAAKAEEAAMARALQHLKQQITLRLAHLYIQGTPQEALRLVGQNPFLWFDSPPSFYGGAVDLSQSIPRHTQRWYYDTGTGRIIYVAEHHDYLMIDDKNKRFVQFVLKLNHQAVDISEQRASWALELHPVTPYRWF